MSELEPITFRCDGERHSASVAVDRYVREQGWAIGPSDITGCRGVMFDERCIIAKWKNLTQVDE